MNFFTKRLISLRTEQKLRQKDLASNINIALRTYLYYESGEREPTLSTLIDLADFFNVSLDYLVGRSNDPIKH